MRDLYGWSLWWVFCCDEDYIISISGSRTSSDSIFVKFTMVFRSGYCCFCIDVPFMFYFVPLLCVATVLIFHWFTWFLFSKCGFYVLVYCIVSVGVIPCIICLQMTINHTKLFITHHVMLQIIPFSIREVWIFRLFTIVFLCLCIRLVVSLGCSVDKVSAVLDKRQQLGPRVGPTAI